MSLRLCSAAPAQVAAAGLRLKLKGPGRSRLAVLTTMSPCLTRSDSLQGSAAQLKPGALLQ